MKKYLFIIFLFISINKLHSQSYVNEIKADINDLAKSTLYVVLDINNEDNKKYADIITEYWKYSKIEIIEFKEIYNHINNNSFFFTPFIRYYKNETTYSQDSKVYLDFQLTIWRFFQPFVKKYNSNPKKYKVSEIMDNANILAQIDLTADDSKTFSINKVFADDFMGKGYLCNYGEGILKNGIQNIQNIILKKDFHTYNETYCNPKELIKLENSTLYIPDYIVSENINSKIEERGKLKVSTKEDYPLKSKIISNEELSELIISSETPIYYLSSYFHSLTNFRESLTYTVTNSVTGEIIFCDYSYNNIIYLLYLFVLNQ